MTALSRRGLAGALGLAVGASKAEAAITPMETPEDRLWAAKGRLWLAENRISHLPDNDPCIDSLIMRIDALLAEAAAIRPDTPKAFAVKASIAHLYGDECAAGELVRRWLVYDLMVHGGVLS